VLFAAIHGAHPLGQLKQIKFIADHVTILTDPFLSKFASPVSLAGPRRFVDLPIQITVLPSIYIVIVSHNHCVHLDGNAFR
jgi:L-ascorbate metabolism protein UlaG (beta-lactamase superfamily)